MKPPRIYLSPPHLSGKEQANLTQALMSNWIAPIGPMLDEFEQRVADYVGVAKTLALASGTAAIHLALKHLRLQPDDEVLCSTLTFCASANPIVYEGARPVFIDSDKVSWNMNPNHLEEELRDGAKNGRLPRAVVVVDIFGQSADHDAINEIASRYNIPVIDDAAEALGSTYQGTPVGSQAWASIFSFNGNKIITTGGGGMLCSNDEQLIEEARFLATQARDPAPHYEHSRVGYNYRMSNLLAGVGLAQLDVLDERVKSRRQIFEFYRRELEVLPGITVMPEAAYGCTNRWLSVIQIDPLLFGSTTDTVRIALEQKNIESRPVWKPLHVQPAFQGFRRRAGTVAEGFFRNGLCLPSGSAMNESDLRRVCDCVRSASQRTATTRRAA